MSPPRRQLGEERPCLDCGDDTLNEERCRDCDIEWLFTRNQCSVCKQRRFSRDVITGIGVPAVDIWGEPCACDPLPITVYEESRAWRQS